MRALTVCGPFRGVTGHDHHVREFVRSLVHRGVRVQLFDMPLWSARKLPFSLCDPFFEKLRKPVGAKVALHFCMPHQVLESRLLRNVNYTMFEATPAPSHWVDRNREHDLVIVPTESSRNAWIAGGMPGERIRLCPLGLDPERFNGGGGPLPLQLSNGVPVSRYRVRFLNVSELIARKNIVGLLRAWVKATNAADDAVLILKLGYRGEDVLNTFRAQLETLQVELRRTLAEAAPIHFLYDIYSDSEMPRLYCTATHYCSMSFGEGWDQPAMEAAACGLRLIVPGHSAYSTYLDSSVATLIASRDVSAQAPADDPAAPLFENVRWWQPDEDEAAAHIRSAIEGRDGAGKTAQSRVRTSFTWEKATERLVEILNELDPPTRFWPAWLSRGARARQERS